MLVMLVVAFLGGVLTIASPCVLPVLPILLGTGSKRGGRDRLMLLLGLGVSFVAVSALGLIGAGWVASAAGLGRSVAIALLALVGVSLLWPRLAELLARPAVSLGRRLGGIGGHSPGLRSVAVGASTGLLWAPCAGPILGLILSTAVARGVNGEAILTLSVYAAGAATALAIALTGSAHLLNWLRLRARGDEWLRRGLGGVTLAGVALVGVGWDRTLWSRVTFPGTDRIERAALLRSGAAPAGRPMPLGDALPMPTASRLHDEGAAPGFTGATAWINSPALTIEQLRGKVVLVNFWTFECINCLHVLPYVKRWYATYKDSGLMVIGVHTPEFPRERERANVEREVKSLGIEYPVVMDNGYAIWRAYQNEYWPAAYFVDARGTVRFHHFGEGRYEDSEATIRSLLQEARRLKEQE